MAAAGLVLAAATSGVVLSGAAPAQAVDWGSATPTPDATPTAAPSNTGSPSSTATPGTAPTSVTPLSTPPDLSSGLSATSSTSAGPAMPSIPPSPALHVSIPAIAVNAQILPVDSTPTGARNAWGGEIYSTINFPVDKDVRQWIRRGDPNSLPAAQSADNVKAFDRTVLYGHASDIGNHLVFQDLSSLRAGDSVTVDTALGRFVYRVTNVVTRAKANLNDLAALYQYPTDGEKDLALVACLPNATSNVVVFAALTTARAPRS